MRDGNRVLIFGLHFGFWVVQTGEISSMPGDVLKLQNEWYQYVCQFKNSSKNKQSSTV